MVFIVKIPNRSRANTPEPSTTPANELPSGADYMDVQTPPPPQSAASSNRNNGLLRAEGASGREEAAAPSINADSPTSTSAPLASSAAPQAAELDVLLAPSVLHHRYVRGVDKSLIVERPERIRAVLLGVATAIGKSASDPRSPPLPASSSSFGLPPSTTKALETATQNQHASDQAGSSTSATATAAPSVPAINAPTLDDDDLVARLSSLSVQSSAASQSSTPQPPQKFRVLHSTRSMQLDPPHPAVAFAHAHSDELVTVLESAYDQAKQKRREARAGTSDSLSTPAQQYSGSGIKSEREATPTPASVAEAAQPDPSPSSSTTSHAAYLEYLCKHAPNHPPLSQSKPQHSSPAKSIPEDSEAYTSSDGEGDDAMHLSEVPEHLPQGDLYLAGPSKDGGMDGGSAEAIRHAMGACCEAVDRVVAAASAGSASPTFSPLREIKYDAGHMASTQQAPAESTSPGNAALPAKRAFVLCRPPGHHCSGSTPQGFCWVNNAIVASAHAYLDHAIDRVVIFDIDLHHGNGTQNLAWRINADANKHDDQRAERLAALRAGALDRARQALGSGSGRAHASRVAKVTLTEQDEAEARRQAGPRALRLFYSSLHDIESFPCEDGDPNMIKDASTCVEGAHGQWIWNVHLDHYRTESDFKKLYDEKYKILFTKAARFLAATAAAPHSTLVLISAGFDACAYEYPGMQRHGKHVPPSFYHTFARDAVRFAEAHAQGKLISVLEGGYSDRALCSAALAHVTGLAVSSATSAAGEAGVEAEAEYWKLENLIAVEKVAKKMAAHAAAAAAGGSASTNTTPKRRQAELAPWLSLTSRAFAAFEQACGKQHVVPLGATGRGASASGRASEGTSTFNSPAAAAFGTGRVLRDRSARRPATLDASTPQTGRRAASPTKATPTRGAAAGKKESPGKRSSPSKATARSSGGGPFGAPVTPVKAETHVEDESMSMDTDTPTRPPPAAAASSTVLSTRHPVPFASTTNTSVAQQQEGSTPRSPQKASTAADPLPHASTSPPAAPKPDPESTIPSSTNYIAAVSYPQSPPLTAAPVTLVDAMSATHQVVDVNTRALADDPLGLERLRRHDFHFANGEADDEDAPGSPDPEVRKLLEAAQAREYFPLQSAPSDGDSTPAGLGAFSGLSLEHATLTAMPGSWTGRPTAIQQQQEDARAEREKAAGLYPHLPAA